MNLDLYMNLSTTLMLETQRTLSSEDPVPAWMVSKGNFFWLQFILSYLPKQQILLINRFIIDFFTL
jgi:hypothetical protein